MTCNNCGSSLKPVNIPEPEESGHFTEEYECVNCGAKGFVSGKEQQAPHKWNKYGAAYEGYQL